MKLVKRFTTPNGKECIEICLDVNHSKDIDEAAYTDFKVFYHWNYHTSKPVVKEISKAFLALPTSEKTIDDINWQEIYADFKEPELVEQD